MECVYCDFKIGDLVHKKWEEHHDEEFEITCPKCKEEGSASRTTKH